MWRKLIAGVALLAVMPFANANTYLYTSALNGFQEVPSTPSQAVGVIQLTLDDTLLTANGAGVIFFLGGAPAAFHIHNAPYGSNGPVVLDIGTTGISGSTVNFTKTLSDAASFASLKSLLDARNGYFNVHTAGFPSGEIRGQIAPVPEPAVLAICGVGIANLVLRRRRKF
ncbi:MAG: CHRD domain-containing protein [Armatimonadetes bacterium]|nr:CHRD domain-containing protein [Armatimonadota bacterium]